ncbi:protein SYS1 homolog [Convolutriloba macropyga]|uniref:protein SYS1 homolog n=1 Tax=Convolutriloba macropyga TaxID=536237 RepID=UPI003F51CCD3
MGTVRFRSSSFDPKLLIAQIISMQCLYYVCLCTMLLMMCLIFPDHGVTLQHVLSYDAIGVSNVSERVNSSIFVINSLLMAITIWLLVGRSKLCTDFSFTLLFYHWILSTLYPSSWASIPSKWSWYCLHLVCALLTTVLAEYLCMRTELRAVPISGGGANGGSSSNGSTATSSATNSLPNDAIPINAESQV